MEKRPDAYSVVNSAIERPSRAEAEEAVATLIRWAGDNPARAGLRDTPKRVVDSYSELFAGNFRDPAQDLACTFPTEGGYSEIVLVSDISFHSHCEHHITPFFGKAHIGYIPTDRIVGLSRIVHLVHTFARRLQTQERMTAEIGEMLQTTLKAQGVAVILEAEHLCMSMRGVRQAGTQTLTAHFTGVFRNEPSRQAQFLSMSRRVQP